VTSDGSSAAGGAVLPSKGAHVLCVCVCVPLVGGPEYLASAIGTTCVCECGDVQ